MAHLARGRRVGFAPAGPFYADLRARVDVFFRQRGIGRHADAAMIGKTAVLFAWVAASYAVVVFAPLSGWARALGCVVRTRDGLLRGTLRQ